MAGNPLAADPSRTTDLRRSMAAVMRRRFRELRQAVRQFVEIDDELGLESRGGIFNARTFQFTSDEGKVEAFQDWFKKQVDNNIFDIIDEYKPNQPWIAKYVGSAYRRGRVRAYGQVKPPKGPSTQQFYEGKREQFLADAFSQPERVGKLRLLYARDYAKLRGITDDMSGKLGAILADGIAAGNSPNAVARKMASEIDGITKNRAEKLARTEIIHAHAEGQLDMFEDLGIESVGMQAEIKTAGDNRVCQICFSASQYTYTIAEARGIIPLHPLCRCVWTPVLTTVTTKTKKRR